MVGELHNRNRHRLSRMFLKLANDLLKKMHLSHRLNENKAAKRHLSPHEEASKSPMRHSLSICLMRAVGFNEHQLS